MQTITLFQSISGVITTPDFDMAALNPKISLFTVNTLVGGNSSLKGTYLKARAHSHKTICMAGYEPW